MILQDVFHPEQMGQRFSADEMAKMDEEAKTDTSLPMAFKAEPGFFDGMGTGAWKGLVYGAEKTGSSLLGVASSTIANPIAVQSAAEDAEEELAEQGVKFHIDDMSGYSRRQSEVFDRKAKELRQEARRFDVDPATMGTAAQILHGLTSTIPQAIGYSMVAGPAGGSVLFGADMGIRTAQELKDKGVDERTATNAGMASFVSNALGMRLPAAFGPNRIVSALAGGAVNVGTTGAEQGAISYILANQDYKKLSEQYQLTLPGAATSAFFGAAMGALFFHSKPATIRRAEEKATAAQVEDTLYARLMATETYKGKEKEARATAAAQARSAINLAKAAGQNVMDILPKISFDKDGKASVPAGDFLKLGGGGASSNAVMDSRYRTLRRSREFDNALKQWETKKGPISFNLGKPSWVLQLFGVSDKIPVTASRDSFIHVLFPPNVRVNRIQGKHGIKAEELQGLLIGIQNPIAVFSSESKKVAPGSKSLILLTELRRNGENVIAPLRITVLKNGGLRVDNSIRSAYEKKNIREWVNRGLLLGYDAEKGPEVLQTSMRSISGQLGRGLTKRHVAQWSIRSAIPTDPISEPIVYRNSTTIGDNYQKGTGGKVQGFYRSNDNSIHLTPDANLATFSHEWGHWYLTNLFQFAKDGRITAEMQEDVSTLLQSFGIKSLEDWDVLGFEGQERFQEQFA
ncbi:MAG: hypothetical protein MR009_01340, partial [Sutterellaceae bacterium]|nr:hypothetical protein [Sutterellaceae bacterium]